MSGMPGVQWRDPDLHEVIEFLQNPNSVIKVTSVILIIFVTNYTALCPHQSPFAGERCGVPAAPVLHGRPSEGQDETAGRDSSPGGAPQSRDSRDPQEQLWGPQVIQGCRKLVLEIMTNWSLKGLESLD